jgi:hypothetical protein
MQATESQSPPTTTTLTYPEKLLGYTEESKAHFKRSKYTHKYLSRKATASLTSAKQDKDFESIRNDERFKALVMK